MTALPILPLLYFAIINTGLVLLGYILVKKGMILSGWILLALSILACNLLFLDAQPALRMLTIIATTFTAMKVVATAQTYYQKNLPLSFKQWCVFALGWAGMRPQPFENYPAPTLPGAWPMIRFGLSRLAAGLLLILLARQLVFIPFNPYLKHITISIILLVGYSLILHFGVLSISAGAWRLQGVNTYYLFRQPVKALSLNEFWSKRWNLAFSEMTSITIFRPLKNKIGAAPTLLLAFAFSGLLHELALSVPVKSGYGLPLLYFIIQGTLVIMEKILMKRNVQFFGFNWMARCWTLFWVTAPAPLLFHAQFIQQIVWPLAGLRY